VLQQREREREKKKRVTQYFIWASKGGKEREEKSWLLVKLFDHQKNALCEKKGRTAL
jgi:hypothetical protein